MQVCSFRSSFYLDVLRHFASFHTDSRFLLCVFCLKVTRNPVSYQQHLLRHQVSWVARSGPGPGPLLDRPSLTDGPVSVSGEPGVPLQQVSSSVCPPERQNSAQAGKPSQLPETGPAGRPASRVQGQLRGPSVSKHLQLCPHSPSRPQVTIRTYRKVRTPAPSQLQSPSPLIQPISIKTEPQMSLIQTGPGRASRAAEPSLAPPKRPLSRRGQTSR